MDSERRGRVIVMTGLLLFFLGQAGSSILGYWKPSVREWLGERIGRNSSHRGEKYATQLLAYGIAIAGTCLALRRREIAGYGLLGTCYVLLAVRKEVFFVWEGGRLFDKEHLGPWLYLMIGLLMFWAAYREHQRREEALAVLEEVK